MDAVSDFDQRRLLKKRCRILPAGGLGVSPSFNKSPKDWGIQGVERDFLVTLQRV